jgi:hypothetical protein
MFKPGPVDMAPTTPGSEPENGHRTHCADVARGILAPMREAFAHEAAVELRSGDHAALGAAVTITLCGQLEHEPPCPLAPHFSRTEKVRDHVRLRVLFVTEPEREREVRSLIQTALEQGSLHTPDGGASWVVIESRPTEVFDEEREHARRLARTD